ncbi:uncharacterized protein LOC128740164 [Sabethes cyaneus]|uniref:uncharacterized protein LOC128740164 n=1 Tax=Sabethes cyaneus TaxID=53552 RepID=UPI00237D52B4|nr:uncharacterized protein LOC128740164 [Sabethes cyaneus]
MPKDLPNFSGDPQEWPLFHSAFCNSTEACGYTDSENLARLQRCLKGNALEAVRSRLLMPQSVPALRAVPSPKVDNLESLITFGLAVQNAVDHMSIANLNNHLWNPKLLCELVEKLKMEWSSFMRSSTNVNLATFGAFMSELVMMASDVTLPVDMVGVSAKPFKTRREKQKLYVHYEEIRTEKADISAVKSVTKPVKKICTYCGCVNHEIVDCTQFKVLDMDGRWKAIKQKNWSCLIPHKKWPCRSNRECGVDGCRIHHHMLLHSTRNPPYKGETANKSQSTSNVKSIVHQNLHSSIAYSLFRYLPITIHANGQQMKSFAFLDDRSSSTLLDSSIAMALGITGPTDKFSLSWTGNISREEKGSQRVTVVISGDRKQFKLNNVRTVQELRLPCQTMQYEELQQIHPHLKGLPIRSYKEATPGIIIGLEHVRLLTSHNRELHEQMRQYFAIEESSVTIKPEGKDDKRAREIMETTTRRVNGLFETGLLWKFDSFSFPDSYPIAVRRMKALEKRFSKDPVLAGKVRETITQYESKGYALLITSEELQSTDPSKVWYLPLGVVQNPKKPNKIRLIWDAKARAGEVSFNDMLMPGPDLLVALVAVLLRFRQRNIAVVGDIREMFHQILIRNEDKQSQSFLYQPSEELPPQIYVMNVATFGATCSPSLAQFVKNKNASEFAERFPRAAKAIIENHYVDDFLDSLDSEAEAIQLVNEMKYVHSQAGFEIRNFCSNSTKVLAAIGEQKASSSVSLNLEKALGTERVLGMIWRPTEDVFTFDPSTLNEDIKALIGGAVAPTKRQVLKTIMSLFDPLGLISHFVVHGKILMQLIWRSGTDWDESIPEELRAVWSQAHLFMDASELARAAVLYLRLVNNNKVRCTLVAAKTKVALLKPVSVPRLELQAAMIGVRMLDKVLVSLDIPVIRRFLWSDSSTVLSWLRSDSRRFHQFVAVRVGEILSTTSVDEWHYVPSKLNAADAKWKDEHIFADNNTWYNAPDFLYKSPEHWPSKLPKKELEIVSELRAVFLFHGMEQKPLLDVSRFSNWNRLVRTVGYTIRAVRRFKGEKHHNPAFLAQEELKLAEILLWRQIQNEAYADEGSILKHNRAFPEDPLSIPNTSPLYRLSPFIDEDGVIRMDSRITAAPMIPVEAKYPILLPKKHAAVSLLVGEYHRRFLHANGETVCNEMRQKFFISGLRSLIRQVPKSCLHCRIKKATPQPPMMASLPEARVTGFVRPFTHTGVDYFGPVIVKQGRSLVKRWVALFTCLAIRAIHLELVYNLSTQLCIMAIRRFVARRGFPEAFYSDNGTNFVGASNLLTKQIHEDCAVTFISAKTRWCFNPPSAPHMDGSWERMVRSVKAAISVVADHPHHPSDEVFQTVILEAEATVNSRPLTYIPLECSEQAALTPNHFLLFGTKGVVQPELVINPNLNTLRDSWRLAQTLVNHFWTRWVREYLPMITRRTKWFKPTKPLESGDLVIVVEDGKRNGWLRGQVVDVMKAADGQCRVEPFHYTVRVRSTREVYFDSEIVKESYEVYRPKRWLLVTYYSLRSSELSNVLGNRGFYVNDSSSG